MADAFTIEPTGRDDEWEWQTVRVCDGVIVGLHITRERAQAFADNGGEPVLEVDEPEEDDDQLDLFWRQA